MFAHLWRRHTRRPNRLAPACFGALLIAAAGCAAPARFSAVPEALATSADPGIGTARFLVARETAGFAAEARKALDRERAWRAQTGQTGPLPLADYLAISGGGDSGAFGAGLLTGWSEAGTRPQFKAVTGVSTGALIAPFAFLGPKYDEHLRQLYTGVSRRDIYRPRNLILGVLGDALADNRPLQQLVAKSVDQALLEEIAAEYAKGRILLVGTTNLDSMEPVIWNMTAIAASKDPRALELFRNILVASAAIPAAFPPVMIDVTANGVRYQEMHVDGGTMAQVFFYPPGLQFGRDAEGTAVERARRVYIIRNARLDANWANVERRTLPIATRAVSALMQMQGIGDLYRIFTTTQRDGVDFNLAFIPPTFDTPHTKDFDTVFMQRLFETGQALGRAGYNWRKTPPGYAPATAAEESQPQPAPPVMVPAPSGDRLIPAP